MKIMIGKRMFCPGLVSSVFALLFLVLFVRLGFWQLDRAEYKRTLHQEFIENQAVPEQDANMVINTDDHQAVLWRPVFAKGEFEEDVQILLDNQVNNSVPGYFVYTPIKLLNSGTWLLVNRGWVKAGTDRSVIPPLDRTDDEVSLHGIFKEIPRTGILLGENIIEDMGQGVMRVQKIDLKALGEKMNIELFPLIMRLNTDSDHGYKRDWRLPGSGEEVHEGYAFQWFAFAVTLFIIYLVLNIKKTEGLNDDG